MTLKGLSSDVNKIIGNQYMPPAIYAVLLGHLTPGSILFDDELDNNPERIEILMRGIHEILSLHPDAKELHEKKMKEIELLRR